jgi:hypothetical protein
VAREKVLGDSWLTRAGWTLEGLGLYTTFTMSPPVILCDANAERSVRGALRGEGGRAGGLRRNARAMREASGVV